LIKKLTAAARGRIIILPGGGITERNVRQIVQETGAREVHASARRGIESPMKHQNRRCTLGSEHGPAEYQRFVTDAETVRRLLRALE
jgi:copper homeostasis protein